MCKIIYEDNHLLVVEKAPGLLTQGDATGDDCLLERMKRYIAQKYEKPGAVYLGLVHRMDRPVGGLVALARTSKAAARLSQQLRSHAMQREYLAVVHGCGLSDHCTLRDRLVKEEATGNVRVVEGDEKQAALSAKTGPGMQPAQEAILHYTVLARKTAADTALLHVRLETGRKHQIRVQLAHSGHPIVQDMRYGIDRAGEPIALWGAALRFCHPTRRESMAFFSRPQGKAFDPFTAAVSGWLNEADAQREAQPSQGENQ